MIRVCDSIMGSGKSQSSIAYMNSHPDQKFIYITPYLDEAERIKKGCPGLNFVEPSNQYKKHGFSKLTHTAALIAEGKNITTTHQAFKSYTSDMLDDIKHFQYTLIIDENVEVLERYEVHPGDLQMVVDAGYVTLNDDVYSIANENYHGIILSDMFTLLKSRDLLRVKNGKKGKGDDLFYWALPPDLITAFKDVYILTYLFEGQALHHFLKIYHLEYERIGIERTEDGGYRFGAYPGYVPEYVSHLKDRIQILEHEKLNAIGDDYYALSLAWFNRGGEPVKQLKNNVSNCFNNVWRDVPAERRMWGAYKSAYNQLKGKGYAKAYTTFNMRATNKYRTKDVLCYPINAFMNVGEKALYKKNGIDVDEDLYAVSIIVQWIWRSAIRDGNSIRLYVPSRRMRTLLLRWIDSVSKGESMSA